MSGLIKQVIDHNGHEVEKDPNVYFNGCVDAAIDVMDGWHKDRAPFYVEAFEEEDFGLLIDRLQESLSTLVVETGMRPKSTEDVRRKVASWVVYRWDPAKLGGLGFDEPEGAAA